MQSFSDVRRLKMSKNISEFHLDHITERVPWIKMIWTMTKITNGIPENFNTINYLCFLPLGKLTFHSIVFPFSKKLTLTSAKLLIVSPLINGKLWGKFGSSFGIDTCEKTK